MSEAKPLVVCVAGPTAAGKTEAAVSICEAVRGEVISMDSMQIYRGLSIGVAAPSPEEQRGVPHHMLAYVDPNTPYTVAEYQRDALAAMNTIIARRRLPVFCGGTGLYLQAVSHPLRFAKAFGSAEVRSRLAGEAQTPEGLRRLYERLGEVDPESARRIHINNVRRVIRALEVYETTGEPMSERTDEWDAEPEERWLIFALHYPRDVLYQRIERRVDQMIRRGLVEEVEGLLEQGVQQTAQSMQAIGYKEIIAYLHGSGSLEEAVDAIKTNTRRYAKRQLTWLRRDPRVRWVDLSEFSPAEGAHQLIIQTIMRAQEEEAP